MIDQKLKVLYDDNCAICLRSAEFFEKNKWFPYIAIVPLSEALQHSEWIFDHNFSKDKLALIDIKQNSSFYGVDAFLEILSYKNHWIKKIGKFPPIFFVLDLVYSIICYNRKIIAPMPCKTNCDIMPSHNYFFRILFILLCGIAVHIVTTAFFKNILSQYYIGNTSFGDILFFTGQLVFQWIWFRIARLHDFYNYAGHVSWISFLGAILMAIPYMGLLILQFLNIETSLLGPVCFGMILSYMFFEHSRRVSAGGWPFWLSITWILYRLLIYPFAFKI